MTGMDDLCIAMDVGGTRTRVALVDRAGNIVQREGGETQALAGADEALERIASIIEVLITRTGDRRVVGIGASLGRPRRPGDGHALRSAQPARMGRLLARRRTYSRFGLPVWAANDATLGAVGEHAYGAGPGH